MDLTLPGYNYLGPGNSLEKGEPTNPSDAAALIHDIEYQKYIDAGLNPYTNYNAADEAAILNFASDWGGTVGKAVFTAKRMLAKIGLIDHISLPPAMDDYETETMVGNKRAAVTDIGGPSKIARTDEPITIVTVPRGSVSRPIIGRGAIVHRRSSFKRTGYRRYRRFGKYRKSYRRNYRRRRY